MCALRQLCAKDAITFEAMSGAEPVTIELLPTTKAALMTWWPRGFPSDRPGRENSDDKPQPRAASRHARKEKLGSVRAMHAVSLSISTVPISTLGENGPQRHGGPSFRLARLAMMNVRAPRSDTIRPSSRQHCFGSRRSARRSTTNICARRCVLTVGLRHIPGLPLSAQKRAAPKTWPLLHVTCVDAELGTGVHDAQKRHVLNGLPVHPVLLGHDWSRPSGRWIASWRHRIPTQ
jgi:hypothetical protein